MYPELFIKQADLLKALAHPKRLEIIQLLKNRQLSVTDIYAMLDLPQANISQHLAILKQTKVVSYHKDGKQIIYQLTNPKLVQACDLVREILIDNYPDSLSIQQQNIDLVNLVPLVHDPVCHMQLSPKTANFSLIYQGQTYYFCASGCLLKFKSHAQTYLK